MRLLGSIGGASTSTGSSSGTVKTRVPVGDRWWTLGMLWSQSRPIIDPSSLPSSLSAAGYPTCSSLRLLSPGNAAAQAPSPSLKADTGVQVEARGLWLDGVVAQWFLGTEGDADLRLVGTSSPAAAAASSSSSSQHPQEVPFPFSFRAPAQSGYYRLYLFLYRAGAGVATANLPFAVSE